MKKRLLKNWFWLVILSVAGIKYGTAQGLTPVKLFDVPEINSTIVKETDEYIVENIDDITYVITKKERFPKVNRTYYVSYQDYQDVIGFIYDVIEAEPNKINEVYQLNTEDWFITIHKYKADRYFGEMGFYKKDGTKASNIDALMTLDVLFLASLPIDIWE